jgi:hypothetical protein
MDQTLIQESHLGLGRVHVHIDAIGRQRDEEVNLGAPLLDGSHAVSSLDGVRDRPVLDDAVVDEDVLRTARGPLLAEGRDKAGNRNSGGVLAHRHEVRPVAVHLIEAFFK